MARLGGDASPYRREVHGEPAYVLKRLPAKPGRRVMQRAAEPVNVGSPLPRTPHLVRIARRLVWWLPAEEALDDAVPFLAQVMTLGTWTDIQEVRAELGEDC